MTTQERQQLRENQILTWLIVIVIALFVVTWVVQAHQNSKTTTAAPAPNTTNLPDLKVVSGSDNSSTAQTANPQQTGTTLEGSSQSVQSSQSNLQPAGSTDGMSQTLKQELGL